MYIQLNIIQLLMLLRSFLTALKTANTMICGKISHKT